MMSTVLIYSTLLSSRVSLCTDVPPPSEKIGMGDVCT